MFWNKEIECMERGELQKLQLHNLKKTIERVYNNVPFYRKKLDEVGMTPEKFTRFQDLEEIPYTTKDDLRDNYPYGMFAVPMKEVVRVHASSGTTGKSTVVGYTKNDIGVWTEVVARIIVEAGGTSDDIAQVAFGYGLFTGAFGLHYGLEKVGITVVPTSSGNTEKQINIMKDFGSTILIGTPSYGLYMSEVLQDMGVKREDIKLRLGLFGAECTSENMEAELENRWGITVTQNYGLSEIIGPGVSGECLEKSGLHVSEDHFLPEIIDSNSLKVLDRQSTGELVITTLTKEAFPLLRYRTKDITSLNDEVCACGRTHTRMSRVTGRSDDMLIIKGVNVFPSQIESVLATINHIGPLFQIVVSKKGFVDEMEVWVELIDGNLLESYKELENLEKEIKHKIYTVLGLDVKLKMVGPRTLERSMGKAKLVIDKRKG